jgi:hypothetical protein
LTPNLTVLILQACVCAVVMSYFVPRLFLVLTRLRHNHDGLLPARAQQLLKSFALLLIASWGFINRLDFHLHPDGENRWFPPMVDRWEDSIVWGLMLIAVSAYAWLYWSVDRPRDRRGQPGKT